MKFRLFEEELEAAHQLILNFLIYLLSKDSQWI